MISINAKVREKLRESKIPRQKSIYSLGHKIVELE